MIVSGSRAKCQKKKQLVVSKRVNFISFFPGYIENENMYNIIMAR